VQQYLDKVATEAHISYVAVQQKRIESEASDGIQDKIE
jgi:hypothetical protein